MLSAAGHEVVSEAGTGKGAVVLYVNTPPALVIMCAALGQETKIRDAIVSGAKDYVIKPFNANKLLDAVNRVLNRKPEVKA